MKTGIIILCRYSSSRLPGKILKTIEGDTLLSNIIKRLHRSIHKLPVVVATSTDSSDDIVESYCLKNDINVFRGPLNDVAARFLQCALEYQLDYAIRINGDNLFTDPMLIDEMVDIAINNNYDFVSNVEGRTFPHGLSVEILRTSFYSLIYQNLTSDRLKEHVTLFLYENPQLGNRLNFKNNICPFQGSIQLAIDTPADVEMAKKIIRFAPKPFIELTYCNLIKIYTEITNE